MSINREYAAFRVDLAVPVVRLIYITTMRYAAEHRFDCVLVWKLDRFGRSLLNLVESLNRLASAGVRFIATTQSIDTDESNPASKLLLYILAAVAVLPRGRCQR